MKKIFSILTAVLVSATMFAQDHTYTVAGSSAAAFGNTWAPTDENNDMVRQQDGTYKWEKEDIQLAAGSVDFKVVEDHAWTNAWPSSDYKLTISEGGIYTITITFDPAADDDKKVGANATKTGDAVVLPKVEIKGSWKDGKYDSGWNNGAAYEMTLAQDKKSVSYQLDMQETADLEFGFQFDGSWKANGAELNRENNKTSLASGSGNMKLAADVVGVYKFIYTFEGEQLEVIFPNSTAIVNTTVETKAVKMYENGKLIIIKNGVRYDALGQIVK